MHVANQDGGIFKSGLAFAPAVTLSFRDVRGNELAHYTMHLVATGKVADSELDIPVGAEVWGASATIVASAQ